jgi:hypothetical protein
MGTTAMQSEFLPTLTQGGRTRKHQNPTGRLEVSGQPTNQ